MPISHFIACKNYEERIPTIHMGKVYDDTMKRESFQQVQKNKRIVLVDDEHDVNVTIRIVLEENGFKVDSCADASQALENFTAGLYDLVILDVKLPGMGEFTLYEKIKKLDVKENCVINKPVDNEILLQLIKSVLWTYKN